MPVCDKCDAPIPEGANFCPECADPVTEEDYEAEPSQETGPSEIQIEFGYSTSSRYEDAVELAQKIPTYKAEGEDSDITHKVTLETSDVALASSLWDLISNWQSARMTIDGEGVTKRDLTYGALGCYQSRQEAYNPQEYCYGENERQHNLWGCHQIGLPLIWRRDGWMTWGEFDDQNRWHWDKDRIRHELEKGLHEYRWCPVLDREEVLGVVEALPDGINPERNPNWNYVKDWAEDHEVAVGICPTLETAKELSAGSHRPDWKSNSGLQRADSELEDYREELRELQTQESTSTQSSGCLILLAALGGLPVLALLL